jgi:ribose/xylose/arabinose/galactoside ABC-type transport system permease subunit
MAYDETTYRRQPDDADDPTEYRANGAGATDYRNRRRDPDSYDPGDASIETPRRSYDEYGRDRLGIHLGWEIVLLLAVAVIGYLLYRLDPASLKSPALDTLLVSGTAIGLLTMGAGLSMRAGVPNLAVGPVALAGAVHFAEDGDRGLVPAAWPALAVAAAGGLVLALVIIAFHLPGWAASLAAMLGVIVWIQLRVAPVAPQDTYDPSSQALYLFGGFALLALLGAVLGTIPPIRRGVGRMRPYGDPAQRRGGVAALPVIIALVLSSVFAVAAGILMAAQSTRPIVPDTGVEWTGIAFGTALLAGTSAFGRRGGVFGTLLAVAGMAMFLDYTNRRGLNISLFAIGACAIGGGLLVTRLVETYGKPLPPGGVADDWNTTPGSTNPNWNPDLPDSWSHTAPNQTRPDRWDDGSWGGGR